VPKRSPNSRRTKNHKQADHYSGQLTLAAGALPGIVPPHKQRNSHKHEDEERADGENTRENIQAREKSDDRATDSSKESGIHRGSCFGVNKGEQRWNHVRPRNLGGVPSLTHGPNKQTRGHSLQSTNAHKVLSPTHPNLNKSHRVSSVNVNLRVLHHAHKGQSHQAVNHRDHAQ